jgi:hypothetical protein
MRLMLFSQIALGATLLYLDLSQAGLLDGPRTIRTAPMEPVRPGDQTRRYTPDAVPARVDGPSRPGERPLALPRDMERLAFDMVDNPTFGRVLLISGAIHQGDSDRFETFLDGDAVRASPPDIVALHSPGGRPVEAMRIGRILRARALDVLISPGAACLSACPLMLFGGVDRIVSREGWVGLHQAYFDEGFTVSPVAAVAQIQSLQAAVMDFTVEMGVDGAVHVHALKTPPDQIYYLVGMELTEHRVATRLID